MFRIHRTLMIACAAGALHGQITQLDLHFQSRDVDFSTANSTAPFKSGTSLPPVCSVGQMFFVVNAPAGANLYGCTSLNGWTLESGSGGSGSGASMASQLGDFAVVNTSATMLTIGANCSATTPCSIRFGALVYSFVSGGSVSISAGTGLAYIYVSSAGALTVGHNLTANCTGCVALSGITAFPPDAIPLFTWSATGGTWNAAGGVDQRALLSSKSVVASTGLTSAESSGKTVLAVDSTVVSLQTSAPATSSSTCTTGSWATDSSYYYLCVSLNSWRRAALSTW
jgi:hypothetical protein